MSTALPHARPPGSRRGRALRPGDLIGIIAPSSFLPERTLAREVALIESWGYRTRVGAHVLERRGYLAGTDAQRAADFNALWADPQVAAILCARGGYGAGRLLPLIDWDAVRAQPKLFCGFSDITALHLALEREAGLVTLHGPMAAAIGPAEAYNVGLLQQALAAGEPLGEIPWPSAAQLVEGEPEPVPVTVRSGVAEGRLVGGNLALICSLIGTPWEADLTGRILVVEDTGEKPYRMDRMLNQLRLTGALQQVAGVIFGDSPTCDADPKGPPSLSLAEVIDDLLGPLSVPVLYGFPCGHTGYRATLPLGAMARLDAGAAKVTVLEAATAE